MRAPSTLGTFLRTPIRPAQTRARSPGGGLRLSPAGTVAKTTRHTIGMDTGSTISLASLALGIVVASGGYLTRKKPLNVQSQGLAEGERFRHIRQLQASQHDELYKLALAQGDAHRADADLPLLTLPGWIPSAPVPLQDVQQEWQAAPGPSLTPALQRAQALWPHTAAGTRMPDYVSAINEHTPAGSAYFNGASFRLLAVSPTPAFSMKLTEGWYFDARFRQSLRPGRALRPAGGVGADHR